MNLDYSILAATFASLLLGALILLFIFLLPVDWKYIRLLIDQYLTTSYQRLRRFVKYLRVRWGQSREEEKIDGALFVASLLFLLDVLIMAAK